MPEVRSYWLALLGPLALLLAALPVRAAAFTGTVVSVDRKQRTFEFKVLKGTKMLQGKVITVQIGEQLRERPDRYDPTAGRASDLEKGLLIGANLIRDEKGKGWSCIYFSFDPKDKKKKK